MAVSSLVSDLRGIAGDRVLARPIDRVAFAADASFYRLVPQAVVLAASEGEVVRLFALSREHGVPMTFRAAGTSLSGQAISDGILVETKRHWSRIEVEAGGARVRVQPGAVGAHVNARLAPHGAKIGPDPASIAACAMGGILANNASGNCCGVAQNAYHTLASMRIVLPSGTTIDTADLVRADEALRAREPALWSGLGHLRDRVRADAALTARIRAKYRIKNTTGYSLNAFLDHELPADILQHLMIGSEGTLGFIAEAVLNTVPDYPVKYTGLLCFPDIFAASAAVPALAGADAKAVELMDRASLASIQHAPGAPAFIATLPPGAAALLVEFQAADIAARAGLERTAADACARLDLVHPARFTHDALEQLGLWKLRKGLFTSVGAIRASGTTVIIEDVAFPVDRLAHATSDLRRLFTRHGYDRAIVFGHAKDGNLHFVITQSFNDQAAIDRYARLMDDVVAMVVDDYDGSLKAEHGTGRNMAPFVETEWGPDALAIMRELKGLVDPRHLLNPGVILNDDPQAHLAHLKSLPSIPTHADACIECGFCEGVCPSRHHTLTPRQRIVVERELERLHEAGDARAFASLGHDAEHDVIDTCAADSLCSTQCPVLIDTGALVKHLRHGRHGCAATLAAEWVATHFDLAESTVGAALRAGHVAARVIGDERLQAVSRVATAGATQWVPPMPHAAARTQPGGDAAHADVVFVSACITRTMGSALPGGDGEPEASTAQLFQALCVRAGLRAFVPDASGTCCGVPFSSKGFDDAHEIASAHLRHQMRIWSREGAIPVVLDTSPCAHGVKRDLAGDTSAPPLRVLDVAEYVHDTVLPRLTIAHPLESVVVHPVCSQTVDGIAPRVLAIARACARHVDAPLDGQCCGMAGDRGFSHPALTASATAPLVEAMRARGCDGAFVSSHTCSIALARATGRRWDSLLALVERASR